jgi:hypothetical protein
MAVHVDEIHTEVSSAAQPGTGTQDRSRAGAPSGPWAGEDAWRKARVRVEQLRCRVAAEGFDD